MNEESISERGKERERDKRGRTMCQRRKRLKEKEFKIERQKDRERKREKHTNRQADKQRVCRQVFLTKKRGFVWNYIWMKKEREKGDGRERGRDHVYL